ncbi:hypothetical protein KK092_01555 [Curtobacterium flaccumfaciens pv. flaccumfaciens]|uniref:DNA/RNA non-specific endonuclease n=1 Tax=Curtobacterium flaccumfaciens TaxID=2035 RepID=UPI001BDF0297|nr:DNA/RNA non-specific endonuclease [Curtobacterium flaccumfaciens]MBT1668056.1 hypothetical protein [Curtobacterium flaccumfaciens pv. flaccumfaciens]
MAGGPDQLAEDHGGHLLSAGHGASPYGVNLTPEHGRSVNLGAVRRVENSISKMLREDPNTSVYLSREIQYVGRADRGSIFLIQWGPDGVEHLQQVRVTNLVSHEPATRAGGLAD